MKKPIFSLIALAAMAVASVASAAATVPDKALAFVSSAGKAAGGAFLGALANRGVILGANVFTALQPTLFSAAQEVSNEPFGVVASIASSFDDKGVAIGDEVTVPVAPTRSEKDYTPAMTSAAGDDATASDVAVTITHNKYVDWHMTGEQLRSLENGGNDQEWVRQMIAQGMRTLRNGAERVCAAAIKSGASRAVGAAGTNPFASNIDIIADVRQVLFDNGAPMADLQLCINSTAGTAARKLGIVQQAYQAGSDAERRSGDLLRQFGFRIVESAGIQTHTKGTGASYVTSGSTAAGVRDIALVTGTGTVLPGDIAAFAADSANKYVINNGVAAPGTISLGRPGARVTIPTANALTIGNSYAPNLAFERNAVVGVMRPPLMPDNPLHQKTLISDSTGMTYLLLQIAGDGMVTWRLHLAYGFKVVQGEHVAIVMG